MKPKALVVDDSPETLAVVSGILDSLGHQYDVASCQESARDLLARNDYSYYLLDLEIPVRAGDVNPRIQNGKNLLRDIQRRGNRPAIVMTSHGIDSPDLAIEMMKLGAVDYVTKPFLTAGNTLDKAILDAIHGRQSATWDSLGRAQRGVSEAPVPFSGGELLYYPTHVQLLGVTVITDAGFGHSMGVMQALRHRSRKGIFVPRHGNVLAEIVGAENGINTITSCVGYLRHNITARLLEYRNIQCGPFDVIDHTEQGYFFRDWIVVRVVEENVVPEAPSDLDDPELNERQRWVLRQVDQGVQIRRVMLEQQFAVSEKTAKRDIRELVERGTLRFERTTRPGFYRR